MITLSTLIVLTALLAVPLVWLMPSGRGIDAMTVLAASILAWASPPSAVWIIGYSVLLPPAMTVAERAGMRSALAGMATVLALAAFAFAQLSHGIAWIGGAFFTLRLIHVIAEWWMQRIPVPGVLAHLRYQLFLPALFVGPVHRLPAFERQLARRRWDWPQVLTGAERVLLGAFMAELVGNVLVQKGRAQIEAQLLDGSAFLLDWALSAIDWIALYFTFAGMSAIAIGIAAMMGIALEENFNQPWRSRDLLDFWSRWHISLTNWCRDYVFRPVMALTRSPLAGLCAAMLAIGLWHELSAYYVLWSVWQSLGVVLNRVLLPRLVGPVPVKLRRVLAPVAILGWLALARPVINLMLEILK